MTADLFQWGEEHAHPSFGTDPHLLHRNDSPDTSVEAAYSVDTTRLEAQVLEAIRYFGNAGCISDDIRDLPRFTHYPYSSITARYRALLDKGFIEDTGERRRGKSNRSMRVMRWIKSPS